MGGCLCVRLPVKQMLETGIGGVKTCRTLEGGGLAPKVAPQRLGLLIPELAILYRISVESGEFQGPLEIQNFHPPLIFRDATPPCQSPRMGRLPVKKMDMSSISLVAGTVKSPLVPACASDSPEDILHCCLSNGSKTTLTKPANSEFALSGAFRICS